MAPAAADARGAGRGSIDREVTGPFTGTTYFFFGGGCAFVHQEFDLTYDSGRGTGTVHLEGCATPDGSWAGGFRDDLLVDLVTPRGAHLSGSATGGVFPLDLTLTVRTGDRRFGHVTGTVAVTGTWIADLDGHGTASGDLAGAFTAVRAGHHHGGHRGGDAPRSDFRRASQR